jgi:hypothetical protein
MMTIPDLPHPDLVDAVHDALEVPEDWRPLTILPPAWMMVDLMPDGAKYVNRSAELAAIFSCCRENDGHFWLHLSVSHKRRLPSHNEMRTCKELFLGNREAYAIWPPKARYVNLHPNVLHLFARLEDVAVLPDFTKGTGSL